ncbi:MAG: urate hydroxylase PuuD [Ahrensia sp.]|nr:urate hydroxylase PuuD [Ahrensia sp.]
MYDLTVAMEWLEFAVRWLHVITAIAWIGSSFFFIALDLGLNRNIAGPADGEEWQVHGGGFYHIQKYLIAPDEMPEHLIWHKWQSYWTWISGFFLLFLVYYLGADLYLVDPSVADISTLTAVALSLASLALGWIAYDLLCKSKLAENPTMLMVLLFGVLVGMSYFYTSVFSGRAALLHLGAFTATIMSANVFFIIMPNQRVVVADLKAGRKPDPKYGKIAKLRSTHNNYLTLPVIFMMLSNHYPLAFATEYNWIIASLVFLMGVTIRHYFNSKHARTGNPTWTWIVTVVLFIIVAWLSTAPQYNSAATETAEIITPRQQALIETAGFEDMATIVQGRCAMCHAAEPAWDGILWAPKGVILETHQQIAQHAKTIYIQSAISHAMPPANVSMITNEERAQIANWWRSTQQ